MECAWITITFGGKRLWGSWWRENRRREARPGGGKIKSVRQRSLAGKRVQNGGKMEIVTLGNMARYVWKAVKEKRCTSWLELFSPRHVPGNDWKRDSWGSWWQKSRLLHADRVRKSWSFIKGHYLLYVKIIEALSQFCGLKWVETLEDDVAENTPPLPPLFLACHAS